MVMACAMRVSFWLTSEKAALAKRGSFPNGRKLLRKRVKKCLGRG